MRQKIGFFASFNQGKNDVVNIIKGGAIVTASVAVGCVAADVGYHVVKDTINDGVTLVNNVKEVINPTPITIREKGWFGKSRTVTINPFTGKETEYKGSKEPEALILEL